MPYIVVDDNFHHGDADERYENGRFEEAEAAVAKCRQIVDEYLSSALQDGMTAEALWESYAMFGDDPFVIADGVPAVAFSAWDYARERCAVLRPCARSPAGD